MDDEQRRRIRRLNRQYQQPVSKQEVGSVAGGSAAAGMSQQISAGRGPVAGDTEERSSRSGGDRDKYVKPRGKRPVRQKSSTICGLVGFMIFGLVCFAGYMVYPSRPITLSDVNPSGALRDIAALQSDASTALAPSIRTLSDWLRGLSSGKTTFNDKQQPIKVGLATLAHIKQQSELIQHHIQSAKMSDKLGSVLSTMHAVSNWMKLAIRSANRGSILLSDDVPRLATSAINSIDCADYIAVGQAMREARREVDLSQEQIVNSRGRLVEALASVRDHKDRVKQELRSSSRPHIDWRDPRSVVRWFSSAGRLSSEDLAALHARIDERERLLAVLNAIGPMLVDLEDLTRREVERYAGLAESLRVLDIPAQGLKGNPDKGELCSPVDAQQFINQYNKASLDRDPRVRHAAT